MHACGGRLCTPLSVNLGLLLGLVGSRQPALAARTVCSSRTFCFVCVVVCCGVVVLACLSLSGQVVELLALPRPFAAMKALVMDDVAARTIALLQGKK